MVEIPPTFLPTLRLLPLRDMHRVSVLLTIKYLFRYRPPPRLPKQKRKNTEPPIFSALVLISLPVKTGLSRLTVKFQDFMIRIPHLEVIPSGATQTAIIFSAPT